MEFYKDEIGHFVLEVGEQALVMSRIEAEELFVDIGHALKDDDIQKAMENDG